MPIQASNYFDGLNGRLYRCNILMQFFKRLLQLINISCRINPPAVWTNFFSTVFIRPYNCNDNQID